MHAFSKLLFTTKQITTILKLNSSSHLLSKVLSFCCHVTVFNGHFSSSCHVTCSLTAISSSCHLLPSAWWSLCTQCSCLWKCDVQCTCLWQCTILKILWPVLTVYVIMEMLSYLSRSVDILKFVSPSLLMALNLSLHSGKWWTASLKLCVPMPFESVHVWHNPT